MLSGPADTFVVMALKPLVPNRLVMLAEELAWMSMVQVLAKHCTVHPIMIFEATAVTPPTDLASTKPDAYTVNSVAADRSIVPPCTVPEMVIGPDETSIVTVLDVPVASKLLMLADAAELITMLHEVALHETVPPNTTVFPTALTPPAALAVIEPVAARVRSAAADKSIVPP